MLKNNIELVKKIENAINEGVGSDWTYRDLQEEMNEVLFTESSIVWSIINYEVPNRENTILVDIYSEENDDIDIVAYIEFTNNDDKLIEHIEMYWR